MERKGLRRKMENSNRPAKYWCTYCKESIYEGDDYVVKEGKYYHEKPCYEYVREEYEDME